MSVDNDILEFNLDDNYFLEHCIGDGFTSQSILQHQSNSTTLTHPFSPPFSPGPIRCPKRRGRPIANNAARERSRVKTLRSAFLDLQRTLPAVPPDTKLSKLDILVLATTYIAHLMSALADDTDITQIFAANGCMHPVKKWPMRTRLYAGILSSTVPHASQTPGTSQREVSSIPWFNVNNNNCNNKNNNSGFK